MNNKGLSTRAAESRFVNYVKNDNISKTIILNVIQSVVNKYIHSCTSLFDSKIHIPLGSENDVP